MHVYSTIITLALGLDAALSQPHNHHARHPNLKREVDYNKREIYNVDWRTVDYSGGQGATRPQPTPQAPVPVVQQPAASPTPDSTTGGSTPPAGGSKRGLCYNDKSPSLDIFKSYVGKTISWGWNWDSSPWKLPAGLGYAATLHSLKPEVTTPWKANAQKVIDSAKGSTAYILGFNEPDIDTEAKLSPADAAAAWKQYIDPFKGQAKFGSPQISNGILKPNPKTGFNMGIDWMNEFLPKCGGCQIDFYAIHWYGCGDGCSVDTDVQKFKDYIKEAKGLPGIADGTRTLWLTEFGTLNANKADFIKKVLPFLDGEKAVERYSYFMVREGDLTTGGALNDAGKAYVTG